MMIQVCYAMHIIWNLTEDGLPWVANLCFPSAPGQTSGFSIQLTCGFKEKMQVWNDMVFHHSLKATVTTIWEYIFLWLNAWRFRSHFSVSRNTVCSIYKISFFMYVCMYVCTYVCMYVMHVCMYARMYVCMYACNACMHVCMYVCMYVCTHVCMHAWWHMYKYTYLALEL